MFFDDPDTSYRIISVLELSWSSSCARVAPRPFNALSFRLKGDCRISDAFHSGELSDNDMLLMPADTAYTLDSNAESIIVIHFETSKKLPERFEIFSPADAISFEKRFKKLNLIWTEKRPGYYLRAMSSLYLVFEQLSRQLSPDYQTESYLSIAESIKYIRLNFCDPELRVGELCRISGLCDTQYRKKFHAVFGVTPLQYINDMRIEHACELLDGGFFSIEEIARRSGFNDPKYFSTVFRQRMSRSPMNYKKDGARVQ